VIEQHSFEANRSAVRSDAPLDDAAVILRGEPTINDDQRADLWDLYHATKTPSELARHLQAIPVHPDLKQQLFTAKQKSVDPIDRVVEVLSQLKQIDPRTLDLAEKSPTVLKALMSAAVKE
jgi:hypothetical protein